MVSNSAATVEIQDESERSGDLRGDPDLRFLDRRLEDGDHLLRFLSVEDRSARNDNIAPWMQRCGVSITSLEKHVHRL